jgi:hypothetical protein
MSQPRIPERGAQRENRAMVVGITLLFVAGHRPVAESGVLGAVKHQFVLAAWRKGWKYGKPRFHVDIADS